jgi:hypothetical protein
MRPSHGERETPGDKGVRAKLRRAVPAVLIAFVAGLASGAAGEGVHPSTGADQVRHTERSACPDPDGGGTPCGSACPCTCCPGPTTTAAFSAAQPSVEAARGKPREDLPFGDLPSEGVRFGVFRPPRA